MDHVHTVTKDTKTDFKRSFSILNAKKILKKKPSKTMVTIANNALVFVLVAYVINISQYDLNTVQYFKDFNLST